MTGKPTEHDSSQVIALVLGPYNPGSHLSHNNRKVEHFLMESNYLPLLKYYLSIFLPVYVYDAL